MRQELKSGHSYAAQPRLNGCSASLLRFHYWRLFPGQSFSTSFECRVYQTKTRRAEKKWDFGIAGGVHDDVSWVCLSERSQKFIPMAITWVILLVANGVKVAFTSITSCCVRIRERKNGGNCVNRRTESSPAFGISHCVPDLTSSLSTSG